MRKLHLLLGTLLLTATFNVFAYGCFPSCYVPCILPPCYYDVTIPQSKGGLKFGLELLFSRPAVTQLDYALTVNFSGEIQLDKLNPHYEWNYGLDIGYDFPCSGNDVRLNYLNINQHEQESISEGPILASSVTGLDTIPLITDVVSVVGIPGDTGIAVGSLVSPATLGFIIADTNFREDRLDLEFSQNIHVGPYLRLRFEGGLRGTHVKNQFSNRLGIDLRDNQTVELNGFAIDPAIPGGIEPFIETVDLGAVDLEFRHRILQESNYSGIGPRLGIETNYYLDIGISVFAGMSTSLLVGEIDSSLTESTRSSFSAVVTDVTIVNPDPAVVLVPTLAAGDTLTEEIDTVQKISNNSKTRVVPCLEGKIGVSYSPYLPCTCSHVFLEAGYMVTHYFNMVDRITNNLETTAMTMQQTLDLTYDGIYLKVEMRA